MINHNYRITPFNSRWITLSWTCSDVEKFSWVIIDGVNTCGPIISDSPQRNINLPLKADDITAIEIHDLREDEFPEAINSPVNNRPTLCWNFLDNAVRYKIYHREQGGDETEILEVPANMNQVILPENLTGSDQLENYRYHFFRVEAVDIYGNESTRQSWRFLSNDLPAVKGELSITQGQAAGTFNFNITSE